MTTSAMRIPKSATGQPRSVLAALVAFLVTALVISGAAFISAPTKGIRILPLGPYLTEAFKSGRLFVFGGIGLGVIVGILAAVMIYRVWGNQRQRTETLSAYVFLAPYLVITLIFTVGVLLFALYIAFQKYDIFTPPQFVGLANFAKAFNTKDFIQSLVNVLWYSVVVTVVQTTLALLLAVLLNSKLSGKNFFRTIIYTPSVTSSVVISMIFWWLYLKTGYLNFGIEKLAGLFGATWDKVEWLNNPRAACSS